jgi:hypothetical protein
VTRAAALAPALLLAGCNAIEERRSLPQAKPIGRAGGDTLYRFDDHEGHARCWLWSHGIACIERTYP